ncbi:repulsive guidance molecule B [Nematostella vectensis]|uniref:repulsive guidance molecule B n=1 Tax=Nematostella vectensis TaxID=45351 RepID=UPI0020775822|nr:repulsive guidance molecule B [Nematostella vectensis]
MVSNTGTILACEFLLLLICVDFIQVTIAFPALAEQGGSKKSNSSCQVQPKCTDPYVQREADTAFKLCASLKLYKLCLDRIRKQCRGSGGIYYNTVRTLVPVLMRNHKCDNVTLPEKEKGLLNIFKKRQMQGNIPPKPTVKPKCTRTKRLYSKSEEKKYCGLFGDPHLRTFEDAKQTCVVEGAWPLVENHFLIVQVTNVPLVDGSSATATNKITVIIQENKDSCVQQKIYKAKSGALPAAFDDGTSTTGTSECSVRILEVEKNSLIHIRLCHIGTDIYVRQVSQYLTFHIRMPHALTSEDFSMGLCVNGCPKQQIIDYRELLSFTERRLAKVLPRKKITRREAKKKCQDSNVTGFYLDSCMFDLLTTGDSNFTLAAKSALDDAFVMDPVGTVKDLRNYNVTIPKDASETETKQKHSSASSPSFCLVSHCLIASLWFVLLHRFI